MKDLVVLAADKDMEHALKGLMGRPEALSIGPIEADIRVHPEHDPACALRGVEFLANLSGRYRHGLLIFDHEGSGREASAPQELQEAINEEFGGSAWGDRARAIVLAPELEAWIWGDSPHIDEVAGWANRDPGLRPWLIERGYLEEGQAKPADPKEAFQAALRKAGMPRSASLYEKMARRVSLLHCTDPAFLEFRSLLSTWFPPEREEPNQPGSPGTRL